MYRTALSNSYRKLQVNLFFTICFSLLYVANHAQQKEAVKPGRLTGVIRDENNNGIGNVSISIEKTNKGTTTSVTGDYLLILAPGSYTVLISAINFAPQRIPEIIIRSNEVTDLPVTLSAARKDTLGGVTVVATGRRATIAGLLQQQKNAPGMTDGISTEQMVKLPGTNIAKVLGRVSGLTVQNEKFVTIRGISDRYINVMINGSILPSTEPNRRNFSFDIVPAALVDNVIVNKTATPDLSGEFTGGIVQVFTKDVPIRNFIQITIGTGINTASWDKPFLSFERDKAANIGKINSDRLWFGDGRLIDPVQYRQDYVKGDIDSASLRMRRARIPNTWRLHRYGYMPLQNYQLSGGMSKRFSNGNSVGMIGAVTYHNEHLCEEGTLGNSGSAVYDNIRNKFSTSIGALLNATYKTKTHKISWKNLYNLRYSDQYDEKVGVSFSNANTLYIRSNVTLQNKMIQTRLEGEHQVGKKNIKFDWAADYIKLDREQPNTRGVVASQGTGGAFSYDLARTIVGLYGLYSVVLDESRRNIGANLSIPFTINDNRQLIKTGYLYTKRVSDLNGALFNIVADSINKLHPEGRPYSDIVTQENFRNGYLSFRELSSAVGTAGDAYNGTQDLHAAYIMGDIRFLRKFRFVGGVRNENNKSVVHTTFFLYPAVGVLRIVDTVQEYKENDLLPSANLIYSLTKQINLRAAYSKTIARPELVERSPYLYRDVAEQLTVTGQKGLEITRIDNFDLRFEYYPTSGEILSFSLFYKYFDKPVERLYFIGNGESGIQYRNMKNSNARGFEVDFRKSLSFLSPASKFLQRVVVNGNFTYIKGKVVDLVTQFRPGGGDTTFSVDADRPLQGLSPYIINAGIGYDEEKWGFNIAFNRSGRRNITGGSDYLATQFETSRSLLDFQVNCKLLKQKMELKFSASDILNQDFVVYTNIQKQSINNPNPYANNDPKGSAYNPDLDFENYKVKKGTSISVSMTYKF